MSAEFETGVSYEGSFWHLGGQVIEEQPLNSRQVLADAGLDWEVNEVPCFIKLPDGSTVNATDHKALVRSDRPDTVLAVVGAKYHPLQNDTFLSFGDFLCADNQARWSSAASLRNGTRIIASWRIDMKADVVAGDTVEQYGCAYNGHDGGLTFGFGFNQFRLECMNTLKAFIAIGDSERTTIKVRHTANMEEGIQAVKNAINLSKRSFDVSIEEYRTIARKALPVDGLKRYVREVFEAEKFKHECCTSKWNSKYEKDTCLQCGKFTRGIVKLPRAFEHIERLYETAPGQANLDDTYWKAFNAVTNWTTHERGRSDSTRLDAALFGDGKRKNERALQVALDS